MEVKTQYPLAPHTTLKIGGLADTYVETNTNDEFVEVIKNTPLTTPITILGNGSNVLISDSGIRGLVIRNLSKEIIIHESKALEYQSTRAPVSSTHRTENEPGKYLDFNSLDYDESDQPPVQVTMDAGVALPYAINYLIDQGVTGLQWFAYIPGTIGGATALNIHGGKYNLSTFIDSVEIFDRNLGKIVYISKGEDGVFSAQNKKGEEKVFSERNHVSEAQRVSTAKNVSEPNTFSYETSPFIGHPELFILSTTFNLFKGDTARAKATAAAWIAQKAKIQPTNSAGSTFQNPSLEDSVKNWGEQKSAGWIIDHELGWKGKQVGGAQISLKHSNFIINTSSASSADYLTLAGLIQAEVQKRFGFTLKLEVKLLGQF